MTRTGDRRGAGFTTALFIATFILVGMALLLGEPQIALAHDTWVLTHEQEAAAELQPTPAIFTSLTPVNIAIALIAGIFVLGWVIVGRTGAREMFPDLQIRLASQADFAAVAIRLGLAIMLLTAAFGWHPRVGMDYFTGPVLFAADLELLHLKGDWLWLVWLQVVLAIPLAFGIYVRGTALAFLATLLFGFYLFPFELWSYAGVLGGAGIYLLMRGGGVYQIPLPALPETRSIVA